MIRHGEILLVPVAEIPQDTTATECTEFIAGHSETGHHHVLERSAKPIRVTKTAEQVFVELMADARLRHNKTGAHAHETVTVPAGRYVIRRKQEYDFMAKAMRRVWD